MAQTDPRLSALHATLVDLRAQTKLSNDNRGDSPELTIAKHQLRAWIESQLGSIAKEGDEQEVSQRMNEELRKVSLELADDNENGLGSLGPTTLKWDSELLILTTRVGILCGQDASAYAYRKVDGKWRRIWDSEQYDYGHDQPQRLAAVHVLQSHEGGNKIGPVYIMTLGNKSGCSSAWHPVYYRIWRVDSVGPKLLLERSEMAWRRTETFLVGSIAQGTDGVVDALIEFTEKSVDNGVHNREAIRHFKIEGDRVKRVGPVALSPRDFVDEWLTRPWSESANWSYSASLRASHQRIHSDYVAGYFISPTMHCETPDLWQVDFENIDEKQPQDSNANVYFLIRWTPPYRFTMMNVSNKTWPKCNQPDEEADAWRTLFSTQDWRN